jgi:hypothetical protein
MFFGFKISIKILVVTILREKTAFGFPMEIKALRKHYVLTQGDTICIKGIIYRAV